MKCCKNEFSFFKSKFYNHFFFIFKQDFQDNNITYLILYKEQSCKNIGFNNKNNDNDNDNDNNNDNNN